MVAGDILMSRTLTGTHDRLQRSLHARSSSVVVQGGIDGFADDGRYRDLALMRDVAQRRHLLFGQRNLRTDHGIIITVPRIMM